MAGFSGQPITRKAPMAQANAPEKLDPQDILKLLVALYRAVKVPQV